MSPWHVASLLIFKAFLMNGYLVIDGNSIAHAANNGTPLKVGNMPTNAVFGVLRTMRRLMALYAAYKPIVLWDGASWRKMIFAEYKANREASNTVHERKQLAQKEELNKQKPIIEKALQLLGIPQMRAFNMEADDLAAILVDRFRNNPRRKAAVVLVTGDKDWLQLVQEGVTWLDPIHDRKVNASNFQEFTGVETTRQFVEMKALTGDKGDNIAGVGGIGDKGAIDFLKTYQTFANFSNMALDNSFDVSTLPKKFRVLAEDEAKRIAFIKNMNLVDLRTTARPKPVSLVMDNGTPSLSRFKALCARLMFNSILEEVEEWLSVFPAYADGRMIANDQTETQNGKIAS